MTGLLTNDLRETFMRADSTNGTLIHEYVEHAYWCIPSNCWGSPEKVADWLSGETS